MDNKIIGLIVIVLILIIGAVYLLANPSNQNQTAITHQISQTQVTTPISRVTLLIRQLTTGTVPKIIIRQTVLEILKYQPSRLKRLPLILPKN